MRSAVAYFFQEHNNGHEIVGFYSSIDDMQGQRCMHGHVRGWISFLPPAPPVTMDLEVETTTNFILGVPYDQEDVPAEIKNNALPVTLRWCAARAAERGAAGFFFQEHTNGHEIVGFYASAVDATRGERGWHGHARGCVVAPRAAAKPEEKLAAEPPSTLVVDGVANDVEDGWVVVGKPVVQVSDAGDDGAAACSGTAPRLADLD